MRQNHRWACLKSWGMVLSANLLLAVNSMAADIIVPNWNLNNVDKQTRKLTTDFSGTGAVIGAGSKVGDVRNSSLTIDGLTVSTEDDPTAAVTNSSDFAAGGVVYHATAEGNALVINNSTIQGRNLFGGAAFLNDDDNRSQAGIANNNTVRIEGGSTIKASSIDTGENIYGGYTKYWNGHADNNTVIVDNSTIGTAVVNGNIYGGYAERYLIAGVDEDPESAMVMPDVHLNYHADNNKVFIQNGSIVKGNVYGGVGMSPTGNSISIDNSTVDGAVIGVFDNFTIIDSSGAVTGSQIANNTVSISNGATVGSAVVASGQSIPSFNNTLIVDNASVTNGQLVTALMTLWKAPNGDIQNADIYSNNLVYRNVSSPLTMAGEIGAALNLSGTANSNSASLSNLSNLTLNRVVDGSGNESSFGVLNIDRLSTQHLFSIKNASGSLENVNNFNPLYGFVYGGASMQYNEQVNPELLDAAGNPVDINTIDPSIYLDAEGQLPAVLTTPILQKIANSGTNSDGNTVTLTNSHVKANIVGGFSGEIEDVHYTTWQYTPPSGSDPANYKKTVVVRDGSQKITTEYDCGSTGTSCTQTSTNSEDISFADYESAVYSASNNTVVLDNSQVEGTVYGGFVVGADLTTTNVKTVNNTVVLRGNTTLADDAVIYGGNARIGHTTNQLLFDRVSAQGDYVTYKSSQFQNFNEIWQVNADLNTRINFDFSGVNTLVTVDRSTGEGSAPIILTQTTTDISDVVQNGVISDLADTSVELTKNREGVYSYSLTPTKRGASQVGWVLNSVKDHANAEVYGQLPLAGLALALEGPELLSRTVSEAWQSEEEQSVFLNGGYHHTRYITGSGFDLNSGLAQAGLWKKFTPDWMGGFFVKYAGGHYKTFPIEAQGNASAYGGGLMSSLRYSDTGRLEASAQVGYMRLKFNSEELNTSLTSKTPYYGATVGIVENPLMDWALYANFQFLRKMADRVTDSLGQNIHYKAVQSLALQAGTNYQFSQVNWNGLIPSVGVSGIYELDGKSKLEVEGLNDSTASLRGASARAEAGLFYQGQETMFPMSSSLTVFGQVGKRRGFGGEVNINFQF